jgi:hypothetical protein
VRTASITVLGIGALLLACAPERTVALRSGADLPASGLSGARALELVDGTVVRGELVGGDQSYALFHLPTEIMPRRIELSLIERVALRDRRAGMIAGAIIGGIGAAAFGVVVGSLGASKESNCSWDCTPEGRALSYGVAGLVLGSVAGAGIGYGVGRTEWVRLAPAPP